MVMTEDFTESSNGQKRSQLFSQLVFSLCEIADDGYENTQNWNYL